MTLKIEVNVMRQSAFVVVKPITINKFAFVFNFSPVGHASD